MVVFEFVVWWLGLSMLVYSLADILAEKICADDDE